MKAKLAVSTMIALGLTALAVSALAQAPQPKDPFVQAMPQNPYGPGVGYGARGLGADARKLQAVEIELERDASDLVRQLAKAQDDEHRQKLKAKLDEVLGKHFDIRQQRHKSQIEALEAEVNRLKKLVQTRQERRRDIIATRLDQLLRDSEGLGW